MADTEIDTHNKFAVAVHKNYIVILSPVRRFTRDEALLLAAWLVALVADDERFAEVLEAVRST